MRVFYQGTKPTQGYGKHDVGHDVYLAEGVIIEAGAIMPTLAKLDLRTEFDADKFGMAVVPRSSLAKLPLIQANSFGVLEGDYRGQWKMPLRALMIELSAYKGTSVLTMDEDGDATTLSISEIPTEVQKRYGVNSERRIRNGSVYLPKGLRVAQAFPIHKEEIDWIETETLSDTPRGEGGFGSSGAN